MSALEQEGGGDGETGQHNQEADAFIGHIQIDNVGMGRRSWFEAIQMAGHQVVFKLDTGSEVNTITLLDMEKSKIQPSLTRCDIHCKSPSKDGLYS